MATTKAPRIEAMTGDEVAAEAMRQVNPDVVAAYPITPQTEIVQTFSQFVADGRVHTEMIRVESEHSAMSACVGAAAAGARAMTATSANGLALMWEVLYIASSTRVPIVMPVVNRALSGPINIHCDHSDSMGARDAGWIQLYSENCQEIYDNLLQAMRIGEHEDVRLPVMVCFDGFIISHATERVDLLEDEAVQQFIGTPKPDHPLLDLGNPVTYGPLDLFDYYFEHKRQQIEGMERAGPVIKQVAADFASLSGREYGSFETYNLEDADVVIIVLGSAAGTARVALEELQEQGTNVGLVKVRMFRPFADLELRALLKDKAVVGVMDRSASFGAAGGPVFHEVRSALYEESKRPTIVNMIYGLGGREITVKDIQGIAKRLLDIQKSGKPGALVEYVGVRG